MSNYSNTKATIAANVYTNHNHEVTAAMVKTGINTVVDTLIAGGFIYKGVAHPGDAAVSPDANVFYIATAPGTYTNFGSLVVADGEVAILKYNGSWSKEVTGAATAAEVTALGQKIADLSLGKFYGFFPAVADLPAGDTPGFAYVGASSPFAIYVFKDGAWSDSGSVYEPSEGNGEDIDTDAQGKLQFANRPNTDGMGYVILRADKTFASQVTESDTIYEIRYEFDLGGASVTIPSGCVLKFVGGSIKNGTLVLAGTKLEGAPRFYGASLSGTTPTQNFKISWCESGIPQYIADVLSMDGTRVVFDKDVSLGTHSEISVTHIDIDGGGHSVRNMPSMAVGNADISIKDISITQADGNPDVVDFIRKSSESHTGKVNKIEFINVSFDGGNIARAFFTVPPTAAMEVSYVADIRGCHFFNIFHHGIYIACDVSGIIAGNEFDHIGHERLGGDTANYTANALVIGNNTAFNDGETRLGIAHDIEVTGNYFHHIIGSYSNQNDVREIHSVLAYGDNITISYNRSEHLSTQLSTIADTGTDAEAIYLKGRNSNIVGNVVIDGAGESSNAAITAKVPASHHNRITDNVVINTTLAATGIMIGGKKIVVSGNVLQYDGSSSPYSLYMESLTESLICNNVFAAPNGSHKILIRGDAEIFGNLINDSNELTIGSTDAVLNFHDNSITFKVGTYLVRLRDSKYTFIGNRIRVASGTDFTRLINASSSASCVIRNNSFEFDTLTISRLFSGQGAWEVVGNVFTFTNCTISGSVAIIYLPGSGICVKNAIVGTTDIQPSGAIITDIGTTTNRPSPVPAGFQYYDVTKKKFILWNGTAWVNMDGTALS